MNKAKGRPEDVYVINKLKWGFKSW